MIEICTGDMGQSHHRSFDVEVYAPGADTWLEVSSVSWFGDYQARRGNADDQEEEDDDLAHVLPLQAAELLGEPDRYADAAKNSSPMSV